MPDNSRQKLYNALSSQYDLGTFEEFDSKMNNPESRKKLYNAVSQSFDLGDFNTFESKVSPSARQEVPSSLAKPVSVPASIAKPQTPQTLNTGERIVQTAIGQTQLEQPEESPQPKQPTFEHIKANQMQAQRNVQQGLTPQGDKPLADLTFEEFQERFTNKQSQVAQPSKFGLFEQFEKEKSDRSGYAQMIADEKKSAEQNLEQKFGAPYYQLENALKGYGAMLKPFEDKASVIQPQLEQYQLEYEQASSITDEAQRMAAQDAASAKYNAKLKEYQDLEAQYSDKLDALRSYTESPEYTKLQTVNQKLKQSVDKLLDLEYDEKYSPIFAERRAAQAMSDKAYKEGEYDVVTDVIRTTAGNMIKGTAGIINAIASPVADLNEFDKWVDFTVDQWYNTLEPKPSQISAGVNRKYSIVGNNIVLLDEENNVKDVRNRDFTTVNRQTSEAVTDEYNANKSRYGIVEDFSQSEGLSTFLQVISDFYTATKATSIIGKTGAPIAPSMIAVYSTQMYDNFRDEAIRAGMNADAANKYAIGLSVLISSVETIMSPIEMKLAGGGAKSTFRGRLTNQLVDAINTGKMPTSEAVKIVGKAYLKEAGSEVKEELLYEPLAQSLYNAATNELTGKQLDTDTFETGKDALFTAGTVALTTGLFSGMNAKQTVKGEMSAMYRFSLENPDLYKQVMEDKLRLGYVSDDTFKENLKNYENARKGFQFIQTNVQGEAKQDEALSLYLEKMQNDNLASTAITDDLKAFYEDKSKKISDKINKLVLGKETQQPTQVAEQTQAEIITEPQVADELKQQYEQAQATKTVKEVKPVEPIQISTLNGKEVKYKGKKGVLLIDEGGKVTIETDNQVFEIDGDELSDANEFGIKEVGKQDIKVVSNDIAVIDGIEYAVETDEKGNVVALTDNKTGKQALDTNTLVEVEIKRNQTVDNPFVAEAIELNPQTVTQVVIEVNPVRADAINVALTENMNETVDAAIDRLFDGEQLNEQEQLQVELYTTDAIERLETLKERMPEMAESIDRTINGLFAIDDLLSQSKNKKGGKAKRKVGAAKTQKQVAVKANVQQPISARETTSTKQIEQPINKEKDAVQIQTADEGVLRQERPELGLQEVEQGNAQQEVVAQESEQQEEVAPVKEQTVKIGNTTYIQRGDQYFSKQGKGKEKEISQGVYERARTKAEATKPVQPTVTAPQEQGVKAQVQPSAVEVGQADAGTAVADVKAKTGFTETKDMNRMYSDLKTKYGEKKGKQIYEVADRLVNPNRNTIVEIRSNGVIVKEGEKYLFKPFGNTDANSKKWTLYKDVDVTDQFVKPDVSKQESKVEADKGDTKDALAKEQAPALRDVESRKKEMKSENDKLIKRKRELANDRDDVVTGEGKYKNFGKKERDARLEEIRNEVKDIDSKQIALQKELKVIEAKETGSVELFDHPSTNHGSTNTIIYDIKNDKLVERENVVRGKTNDISIEDAAKQKFAKTLRGANQREINEAYTDKVKAKYEAEINDEINKYKSEQLLAKEQPQPTKEQPKTPATKAETPVKEQKTENKEQVKPKKDESKKQERPMLEGVRDGGDKAKAGKESTELRAEAKEEVIIDDLEVDANKSVDKKVKDISKLPLSHVAGVNMRPDQATGTYLSTEKGNRYAKGDKKASNATVTIKKPYVTNDTGNIELRNRVLRANADAFTAEDFALLEVPSGKIGIDDLSDAGVRKLAQLTTDFLKSQGFDSIYFPESNTQEGELIVFDRANVSFEQQADEQFTFTKNGIKYTMRRYGQGKDVKYTRQVVGEGNPETTISDSVFKEQRSKANRRADRSRRAYETRISKEGLREFFDKIDFYNDPYTYIVSMLANGMKIPLSVFKEIYKGESEAKAYADVIDKTSNDIALDSFAEGLQFDYEDTPNANQGNADQDFRDALVSALSLGNKPIDFMSEAVHIYKMENGIYDMERIEMERQAELQMEKDISDATVKEAEEYLNSLTDTEKQQLQKFLNDQDDYQRTDKGVERNVQPTKDKGVQLSEAGKREGDVARPVGNNEKVARKRIEDAERQVKAAKEALDNKKKSLRKQQGEESQLDIFGKPLRAGQLFEEQADISEANFQKALAPLQVELDSAVNELVQAEKALKDAIKADEAQLDIFAPQPVQKEVKGIAKFAEGADMLANLLGAKKNFAPEDKPDIIKALRLMAEGLAEELGIKGKELYAKLKERLLELGYKQVADELDTIKDEIIDDFKGIEPPVAQPPVAQPQAPEGKELRAVSERSAKQFKDMGDEERANQILLDEASYYKPESWKETDPKANEAVDILLEGDKAKVEKTVRAFLRDPKAVVNDENQLKALEGGTMAAFVLLKLRDRLETMGMPELADEVTNKLAETATRFGEFISALQRRAIAEGLVAMEVRKMQKEAEQALENTLIDDINSLKDTIDQLKEKLAVTEQEMAEIVQAKAVSDAAKEAAEKALKKAQAKAKQATLEAQTPKSDDSAKLKKKRVQITGVMRQRNKDIKDLLRQIVSSDNKVSFAMLPENDPVAKLIVLLREQAIDFVRLGITDLAIVRNAMATTISQVANKTKVTADEIWNNIVSEDFDALSAKAQAEYVADKLETAINNILDGKVSQTKQGKILDAIATVLVNRVNDKEKVKADPDKQLKRAVDVIKNRELSLDAAKAALRRVKVLLDDMEMTADERQAAYQKAEEIVNAMTDDSLPEAVVRREIAKGMKTLEATMQQVALGHYTQQDAVRGAIQKSLVDKLVALGIDQASAENYAKAVEKEFNKQLGAKRAKIVEGIMNKDLPTKTADLANNLAKLNRLGGVRAIAEYLDKIGFPSLDRKQAEDIRNAQTKEEVKAIIDTYVKGDNVQKRLTVDMGKKLKDKIDSAKAALTKGLASNPDKVGVANAALKKFGGEPLTDSEIADINFGVLDNDGIIALVANKIQQKQLFAAEGRTATGEKRVQAKKKSATQKLIELAQMGVFNDDKASEIFSENYGIPRLSQKDIDILNVYIDNMVLFSGEISKVYEQLIKDYLEKIKITSPNSHIVLRTNALLRGIDTATTRFLLAGLSTILVSIPLGTIAGYVTQGLPVMMVLIAKNPKLAESIFQLFSENKIKNISVNDFWNVMTGGKSQLQSDFSGQFTDKENVRGNIISYLENVDVKNMTLKQRIAATIAIPYMIPLVLSRFANAFDLLAIHDVGELINIWAEIDAEIASMNKEQGYDTDLNEIMRDNAKRQQLMNIVKTKLGYSDKAAAIAEADAEIELMKDRGVPIKRGLRERLISGNIKKRRNQERMEKSYEKAKRFGFMDLPREGTVEKWIFDKANWLTSIDDKADVKLAGDSNFKAAAVIAKNIIKIIGIKLPYFLFFRIGMKMGKAALQGVPLVGAAVPAFKLRNAKTSMEQIMLGGQITANLAITAAAVAAFLSTFEFVDDEEEEDEERPSFMFLGARVRSVKDPYIKFYGKSPFDTYSQQEKYRIQLENGKSEPYPEWAIQFGNNSPFKVKTIPAIYPVISVLSKMQEPSRVKQYEKIYGNIFEKQKNFQTTDIGVALLETLQANSFAIGSQNFEYMMDGIPALWRTTLDKYTYKSVETGKEKKRDEEFEDKMKVKQFLGTYENMIKNLATPRSMTDMVSMAQNFKGVKEESKNTFVDRVFSDNLYYEAILNPLFFKRQEKAYDAFGLPYKEKVSVDEIIKTLTLDYFAPNEDFAKELESKGTMPLFKLMTNKKVVFPSFGAYEDDVTPDMVGKEEGQKVTIDEAKAVDQYTRLQVSKRLLASYDELNDLEGILLYNRIKSISDSEKKKVLIDLSVNGYTKAQLDKIIAEDVNEVMEWQKEIR